MSMEIPVVGYDVGALSEILGGKDCLGKNTAELTEIIINLLDDRKRRMDIGKANRARAIEKFSVDIMIRQYDDLYARLLAQEERDISIDENTVSSPCVLPYPFLRDRNLHP